MRRTSTFRKLQFEAQKIKPENRDAAVLRKIVKDYEGLCLAERLSDIDEDKNTTPDGDLSDAEYEDEQVMDMYADIVKDN